MLQPNNALVVEIGVLCWVLTSDDVMLLPECADHAARLPTLFLLTSRS